MDFDRSVFKAEFVAAGIWIPVRVTSGDSPPVVTDTHAGYVRPDVVKVSGSLSAEHEIKFVADDLPDLREGDRVDFLDDDGVEIAGKAFKVREAPYVADVPQDDRSGYFKRALLTRVPDDVILREDGTSLRREDAGVFLRE